MLLCNFINECVPLTEICQIVVEMNMLNENATCTTSKRILAKENAQTYTAQQKFSTDFIFILILIRIRNNFYEVINKYGNP